MLLLLIAIAASPLRGAGSTCTALRNRNIFSTVEVKVGTPPQVFDLVADTGSSSLIVQSCVCQEMGSCPYTFGRCFRGHDKSSTFSIPRSSRQDAKAGPEIWILTYGSGDIEAVVASDEVSVGNYTAHMNSSLLLMVSQALNFDDAGFQGILGLGVPNLTARIRRGSRGAGTSHRQPEVLTTFLDEAQVKRFSLCFNSGADGVLGLDYPAPEKLLPILSTDHWALRVQGTSVAGQTVSATKDGQLAIPDSGTTLITGPQTEIASLMETICDKWPRCKQAQDDLAAAMVQSDVSVSGNEARSSIRRLLVAKSQWHKGLPPALLEAAEFTHPSPSGVMALQMLLEDCGSWKKGVDLDAEMPAIEFRLQGADGAQQDIQLLPSSYIAEVSSEALVWSQKYLLGILPYWWPETEEESSCAILLGTANYTGMDQVWILGTPLFYNRRVHFDLSTLQIGFSDEPCGSCDSGNYETVGNPSLVQGATPMRQLRHPGRVPWPRAFESLNH